jgi:hypothetical protein
VSAPSIRLVSSNDVLVHRFRIEVAALEAGWASAHAEHVAQERAAGRAVEETPYCEITIWHQGNTIGSFGGNVWPGAWPALFVFDRGNPHSGPVTYLSEEGLRMVSDALRGAS